MGLHENSQKLSRDVYLSYISMTQNESRKAKCMVKGRYNIKHRGIGMWNSN